MLKESEICSTSMKCVQGAGMMPIQERHHKPLDVTPRTPTLIDKHDDDYRV